MHNAKKIAPCALLCLLCTARTGLFAQEKRRIPIEHNALHPTDSTTRQDDKTREIKPDASPNPKTYTAQQDKPAARTDTPPNRRLQKSATTSLNPVKAGLYSAVLPGLGQAYNRKYWKIPLVYALMGTSAYLIKYNNDKYRRMRTAFIIRLNGGKDEFDDILNTEQIADRAREYERDTDIALFFTIGFYILNVIDAVVDANLSAFNVDSDLSITPALIENPVGTIREPGIAMRFKF